MLLPELSRKNTHGMAPSLNFFRGLYRRFVYRNRKKVFVLGFHKTGTTSLAKALQILGYRVCGFVNPKPEQTPDTISKAELFETRYKPLLNEYDAFEDTPWFIFYKELLDLYPDAKFILTVRNEEQWYSSMVKHFGGFDRAIFRWVYDGKGDPIDNKTQFINTYREHNDQVINHFKNHSNFLLMNMPEDFNWNVLCNFLNCSIPLFGDFPHANTANSRDNFNRKLIDYVKSKYYNYNVE